MATTIQYINGFFTGNNYLNQNQRFVNSVWVYEYLRALPDTPWKDNNSIFALLGNMDIESTVNPGLWESRTVNRSRGFGLVQWTPASKYLNWCSSEKIEPAYMDSGLRRIQWEMENKQQWIATSQFPFSFKEFAGNDERLTLAELTEAFMRCYERPASYGEKLDQRIAAAQKYREYLTGDYVPPDTPPAPSNPTTPGQYWFQNKWYLYLRKNGRR